MLKAVRKLTELELELKDPVEICNLQATKKYPLNDYFLGKLTGVLYKSVKLGLDEALKNDLVPENVKDIVQSKGFKKYLDDVTTWIFKEYYISARITGGSDDRERRRIFLLEEAELFLLLISEDLDQDAIVLGREPQADARIKLKLEYKEFTTEGDPSWLVIKTKVPSFREWEEMKEEE